MKEKENDKSNDRISNLSASDVIASIDRELTFYRHRLYTIYSSVAALQILLVTGQQTIKISNAFFSYIAYTILYVALVLIAYYFNSAYRIRVHHLRDEKIKICKRSGFGKVFPKPHGKLSPSNLYVLTIGLLSFIGIVILFGGK